MDLTSRSQIAELLQSHGLHTQKSFGQHFLTSRTILNLIVATASIQPTDTVVEVGPGIGVLTQELAQRAGRVLTFEIDTSLQLILEQTVGEYANVEVFFQDFRQADLQEVLKNKRHPGASETSDRISPKQTVIATPDPIGGKQSSSDTETPEKIATPLSAPRNDQVWVPANHPYKFVSNLPYNAGSHILDQLLKSPNPPESITALLQKEVAQKIVAQPPHATYLSNFFQLYGQAEIIKTVPPGAFFPPPQVDSAILHVEQNHIRHSELVSESRTNKHQILNQVQDDGERGCSAKYQKLKTINPSVFSRFLHRGFANPRKMLNKAFSPEALNETAINPSARPENLTFDEWVRLFQHTQSSQHS